MSLVDSLTSQYQVVEALVLRETRTRFGAHQLGYLWALIEPVALIVTFAVLFEVGGRQPPSGLPVVPFLTTGIIPYSLFQSTATRTMAAIDSNRGLLFYPQVRPFDVIVARIVLETATLVTVFFLLVGAEAAWSNRVEVPDLPSTLLGLGVAAGLGGALGLVLCSLNVYSNSVERFYGLLSRPLFWCSGLFFTAQDLPESVRELMLLNPILHAVECVRGGWFEGYDRRYFDLLYSVFWVLGLTAVGLVLERAARRHVELT